MEEKYISYYFLLKEDFDKKINFYEKESLFDFFPISHKEGCHILFMDSRITLKRFRDEVIMSIVLLKLGMENGTILSKRLVDLLIKQLKDGLPKAREKKAEGIFLLLIVFLEHVYIPKKEDGLYHLKGGDKIYNSMLNYYCAMELDPLEVHNKGLKEVREIKDKLNDMFDMKDEDYPKFRECMIYHTLNEKRDKNLIIKDINKWIDKGYDSLSKLFYEENIPPRKELKIEELTKFKQVGAASGTFNSSNMTFSYNTYNLLKKPTISIKTLTLHETIPGHFLERWNLNKRYNKADSCSYISIKEGWAVYAEGLLAEPVKKSKDINECLYCNRNPICKRLWELKDDINLSILLSWLVRAVRCVVDTALNHSSIGWSVEKAREFMVEVLPEPIDIINNEIHRYLSIPGRSCAYKVGKDFIIEMKNMVNKKLGDKFDIKEFHYIFLSVPFPPLVMEKYIKDYFGIK